MKRLTRPFVVEVKKKRDSPANRRSIWGDLDLSPVAADPLAVSEEILEPAGNDRDVAPVVEGHRADNTDSAMETASDDGNAHAVANADEPHAEPHFTEDKRKALPRTLRGRPENVSDVATK